MNDSKSLISVLVPAYNTAQFIGQCIESIIRQTYNLLEIIVVDDGSTDNTVEIAQRYASIDNRINVISILHKGVAEARNTCLKYATGEYILFVDSDDWIDQELCTDLVNKAQITSTDIVFSPMLMVSSEKSNCILGDRSVIFNSADILTGSECFIKMVDTGCTYPMVAGNLYRRRLINDNSIMFKGAYHEDEYSFPFLLKYADKICSLFEPKYYYRQRPKSIMNSKSNLKDRAIALGEIVSEFENKLMTWDASTNNRKFVQALSRQISTIKRKAQTLYDNYITQTSNPVVLLLTEKSISSNYGIGTYIRHIAETMPNITWDFIQIEMNAYDKSESEFSTKNGMPCYTFPEYEHRTPDNGHSKQREYQMGIFYYIASRLGNGRKIICHLNAYGYEFISNLFKEHLYARIIFTVHYMDWAFRLNGNRHEMKRILGTKNKTPEEASILKSFEKEYYFFNEYCDYVIAIAQHSYETLIQLYHLPLEKISLIYNSAQNSPKVCLQKDSLRKKYGFTPNDRIIIFAGRIDYGKGIFELVSAFKQVSLKHNNLKLIVAGDGAYNSLLKQINPMWNKIFLTGYLAKETLYELYSLSDIGVVPSLHEEFGYVAIEMASMGLPVLVNLVGGLNEIAEKYDLVCGVSNTNKSFIDNLRDKLLDFFSEKGSKKREIQDVTQIETINSNAKLIELYEKIFQGL